jgi:hypothetical protein
VIFSGFAMGHVRPQYIDKAMKAELSDSLSGNPNEMLLAPWVIL